MRPAAGICLALLALAPVAAAQEEALRLPSGLDARLQEMRTDRRMGSGLIYRFRFVADGFEGGESAFDRVTRDLHWLCTEYALPRIAEIGPRPGRVVISLADRPSDFGIHHPEIVQVFEAFRPAGGTCDWEMF